MSDFLNSQVNSTSKLMDDTGSLVNFEEDTNRVNNNVSIRPTFDLVGMGVSFEDDGGEVVVNCPINSPFESAEDEESILEIPELSKSRGLSLPRTIPFRSASFSQVDVTSDGKYVRNCHSPITLKPTAFCLLNNSTTDKTGSSKGSSSSPYNFGYSSSSTIPRQGEKSVPIPPDSSSSASSSPESFVAGKRTRKFNVLASIPHGHLIQNLQEEKNSEEAEQEARQGSGDSQIKCDQSDSTTTVTTSLIDNSQVPDVSALDREDSDTDFNTSLVNFKDRRDSQGKSLSSETLKIDYSDRMSPVKFYLGSQDESKVISQDSTDSTSGEPVSAQENSGLGSGQRKLEQQQQIDHSDILDNYERNDGQNVDHELASYSDKNSKMQQSSSFDLSEQLTQTIDKTQDQLSPDMKTEENHRNFPGLEVTRSRDDDEKNPLLRQPSGQSDGSDEIPVRSPFTSSNNELDSYQCSSPPLEKDLPTRHPFSGLHSRAQSESTPAGFSIPSSSGMFGGNKKEISRANSVSCSTTGSESSRPLPPRRYKRPLRGPYGEMLEAEMNKLIPVRSLRDYDNSDFCRESKSSSPNRSLNSSLTNVDPEQSKSVSLASSNTLLMASMDDLHFSSSQSKALNHRRKISTQLPLQNAHFPGETASTLAFHQRTASSPSQLLYSTSSDLPSQEPETRRYLDGSPRYTPRGHVLAEVVETEKFYVDSLRILVKKYMEPLKSLDFIDDGLVDEIFFQIPKILWHHESLLESLQKRVTDDMQCVGDVLLETFRQNSLLECYSLFVNNWKNAKGSLKMAVASKPAFARFLEDNARQHKGKLTLDSLLIMPIQRIPRYELLVKELLKHTDPSHEDHSRLNFVLENIRQFALHIDCASVDPNDNREIEIEGWGSGLGHLVRQDIVTLCTNSNVKKERALFLFADSLVIASIKRKSTMRKPSASTSHSSGNSWEGCKFKLLMKIPLMDVHLHDTSSTVPSTTSTSHKSQASASLTETDDLKIIHKMMELADRLTINHSGLDEILKELLSSGLKHVGDNGDSVDFEIKSSDNSDSPEVLKILFGSSEKKSGWLETFSDALGKFIRYGFGKPQVQFLQALPIRKTRAGLQLSCAAPVFLHNKVSKMLEMSDVWLANSDGYVGQICILTLHPEPAITSCNGVCNSRITCIVSVPPPALPQTQPLHPSLAHHQPHESEHHQHPHLHSLGYESEDDTHRNRQGHKTAEQWSVWLGTEDGCLCVYDCSDSVRVKKNRHKIQHSAPLHCIVFFDSRVFVSLGDGNVAIYSRNTSGKGWSWAWDQPCWVTIGSAINPVTKMVVVDPKVRSQVWCACGSQMKVYGENGGMLELQQSIAVTVEGSNLARGISCIVASEELVWVAVQGTSILKCYNNSTFECLYETNVSLDVSKILAGCDDIIRQHKSACLRITALLLSPDKTLWVGTSAGVILTVTNHNQNYKTSPLCYGHTGQVRFLTCCTTRDSCTVISGGDGYEEFRPMPSLFHTNNNNSTSFGSMMSSLMGESSVDISGREDSTNHLLIWKIPKPS